jgi:hypothetical protein
MKAFAVAANDNPIYRIASAVFRVSPTELTNEQISTTRGLFAFFGAVIVSLTGTLAALVHYWPSGRPSALQRAVRGYLLRMRRRVVRIEKVEVPVDRIVEKIVPEVEKPILIEKTLIKYIPYTGGGALPTDETHEKHIEGRPAAEALAAARASNTAHLRVYK